MKIIDNFLFCLSSGFVFRKKKWIQAQFNLIKFDYSIKKFNSNRTFLILVSLNLLLLRVRDNGSFYKSILEQSSRFYRTLVSFEKSTFLLSWNRWSFWLFFIYCLPLSLQPFLAVCSKCCTFFLILRLNFKFSNSHPLQVSVLFYLQGLAGKVRSPDIAMLPFSIVLFSSVSLWYFQSRPIARRLSFGRINVLAK